MMSVSEALANDLGKRNYLGYGAVVDLDEVARSGIHLETVVEGQGRVNRPRGYKA